MKRMNVREFRAKISELTEETIEVTRYGESVGYWVPHSMTTMPKKPIKTLKFKPAVRITTSEPSELDDWMTKIMKIRTEMEKLGVVKKSGA